MNRHRQGFTLIELLIVVVIIGILASIAIPKFSATREKAYLSSMKSDLKNLASQQEIYYNDHFSYGPDLATVEATQSDGVTITVNENSGLGWSATATHAALPSEQCGLFHGNADPAGGSPAVAEARPSSVSASKVETAARPATRKSATVAAAQTTTGSIARDGALMAMVPSVTGAPGDGSTSLAAAIQRELQTKGIALADRPSPATYRVEGAVILGNARNGKQPIQIEWVVRAPDGKKLGTVSQKNDIPEGSLDGPWGRVADQAASAAVQGILKLLPPTTATN